MADTIQSTIDIRWGDTLRVSQLVPVTTPVGTRFSRDLAGDLIYLPESGMPRALNLSFTAAVSQSPNYVFVKGAFKLYIGVGQTTQEVPLQYFPGAPENPYFSQITIPAEQLRVNCSWEIEVTNIPPADETFTAVLCAICGPYFPYMQGEKRKGGW